MGANPEPKLDPADEPSDPIRWIGRDAIPLDRVAVREPPAHGVDGGQPRRRTKWIAAVALLVIALAAGAAYWKMRSGSAAPTSLASRDSIPLITVVVPTLKPVTTDVTFTGTIAARYDMPIGIDGDAGRIVAVKAEAGDHVKKGQVLAQLDTSVLEPQVNRLAASLEQARAQAALSAAEYRRAKACRAGRSPLGRGHRKAPRRRRDRRCEREGGRCDARRSTSPARANTRRSTDATESSSHARPK